MNEQVPSKEQVYREALEKIAYPDRGLRPQDKEPFLKGFVPLDRRVAIEALKQAAALVSESAELQAVGEWVKGGSADRPAQPAKERLECDGLVVTDKGPYVDFSFEDQSIAIGTEQEAALRQWLNVRTAHEPPAAPHYLDGLTIEQWREHAKAGWAMYAARADQPPPDDEPSVIGGMTSQPIPPPPTGVERIEWHVRQIEIICDALNLDPTEWLMPDLKALDGDDIPASRPTKHSALPERCPRCGQGHDISNPCSGSGEPDAR